MEDQGKRLLMAVVAAFAIMMVWNQLFPQEQPPKDPVKEPTAEVEAEPSADSESSKPSSSGSAQKGEEKLEEFSFAQFHATTTNYGGSIKSWKLVGEQFVDSDTGAPMELVIAEPNNQTNSTLQVAFGDRALGDVEWQGHRKSDTEIHYTWTGKSLEVTKEYSFNPEEFLVVLLVRVKHLGGDPLKGQLTLLLQQYQNPDEDTSGGLAGIEQGWSGVCYANGGLEQQTGKDLVSEPLLYRGAIKFAGVATGYFLTAVSPRGTEKLSLGCEANATKLGVLTTSLSFPTVTLKSGETTAQEVTAYFGPKFLDRLDGLSKKVGYETGFEHAIDLGWVVFEFIARPLLWLLLWLQSFVINWGVAIILLTVIVKLATLHWSTKSMRSMKAMAKLGPEVKRLQAKYKEDRQRLHAETMALYKVHGVNPLAGCLPMLLQMPIWFALYRMLMAAAELYHAPFIPGWIDDLTATDPYYVLPILLVAAMFLQSRLTPTTGDSAQQKMMKWGMPIMFGGFGFMFPSGLTLYILTNTLITAGHHLWLNRGTNSELPTANKPANSETEPTSDKPVQSVVPSPQTNEGKSSTSAKQTRGRKGRKRRKAGKRKN